ncbi:MAG: hypothetical protein EU533_02775 [Promethearchaeota archaeon]|nr:MAG: hypothetical protein EU533_02775 [Candidatus Lokiarchaeota archaeon]
MVKDDYMDFIDKIKELSLDKDSNRYENLKEAFKLFCLLINENKNIQETIKGKDLSIIFNLNELGTFFITIQDSYAEFGIGEFDPFDFSLTSSVEVIFKLLIGNLDPIEAFFSDLFIIKGDLYYLLEFFQIIEHIILNTLKNGQKLDLVLDSSSLKKLFDLYARGISVLEPIHIPLFFEILTVFANNNSKAKQLITGEDLVIQMNIIKVGKYFIRIVDNKFGWAIGEAPDPNIRFEMGFKTSAEIIFDTDPIDAFMKGKLKVEAKESDMFKVLILKDLTDLLLQHLNL